MTLQSDAQPVVVCVMGVAIRIVQADGVPLPLSGGDLDAVEVVGIPVGVVVGFVLRQVLELFHALLGRLFQRQPCVFQQHGIDGVHRQLIRGTDGLSTFVKAAGELPLGFGHGLGDPGAAVEQLIEVDVQIGRAHV